MYCRHSPVVNCQKMVNAHSVSKRPRRQSVQFDRVLEAEMRNAMNFKAGDQHEDDQRGLRPVPETLVALVKVDAGGVFMILSLRLR